MTNSGTLELLTPEGDGLRFEARFGSGFVTIFDSGADAVAPSPPEHVLGALAACEAMDVVSILRKRRLEVTAYSIAMQGERAETHPRRFRAFTFAHRVTGRGVSVAAVEEAIRLSEAKYCTVRHSLDPAVEVEHHVEVVEA